MAILHGSWIFQPQAQTSENSLESSSEIEPSDRGISDRGGYFFIWGEVWQRVEPIKISAKAGPHPFAMTAEALRDLLHSLHQSQQINWTVAEFPLEAPRSPSRGRSRKRGGSQILEAEPQFNRSSRWHSLSF
ncbi:MAG: hypothetical protein HC772_01345 [Leptolyngbyaceae cyanobacterium CRU_2_3]|nr:hypothetical protein [Leptolyngbyaceae cyanobacterium CRU_2_3]